MLGCCYSGKRAIRLRAVRGSAHSNGGFGVGTRLLLWPPSDRLCQSPGYPGGCLTLDTFPNPLQSTLSSKARPDNLLLPQPLPPYLLPCWWGSPGCPGAKLIVHTQEQQPPPWRGMLGEVGAGGWAVEQVQPLVCLSGLFCSVVVVAIHALCELLPLAPA